MDNNAMLYLYRAGHGWIDDTVTYYNADLHDNRDEEPQKDIMVYGRSQVGKTTFILKLIGINPNKYSALEKILRGGEEEGKREKGKSSTSVATLYSNSDSNYFSLEERNIKTGVCSRVEQLTSEEMSRKLIAIREGLRVWERDKILKIGIPTHYFTKEVKLRTQIIDFPGVSSDSEEEYKYIQEALAFYQLRVSAVIIFELKINIKFLKRPLQAGLRYDLNPNKYILVTTMSFSSEMMVRHYKEDHWTLEEIISKSRDDVRNELDKYSNYQFTNLPDYFPVEIGESFSKLINDEPEYGNLLKQYMEKTFDDIRHLIETKNSNALFNSIEEIRSGKIRGYEDQIRNMTIEKRKKDKKRRNLNQKIIRKKRNIEYFKKQLQDIALDKDDISEILENIGEKKTCIDNGIINQLPLSIKDVDKEKKPRDYMYSCFVRDYSIIADYFSEMMNDVFDTMDKECFEEILNNKFAEVNEQLKVKKAKGFETKKNCEEFWQMTMQGIKRLINGVESVMSSYLHKYEVDFKNQFENLNLQEESIHAKIRLSNESINKMESQIINKERDISNLEKGIADAKVYISNQKAILKEILRCANGICSNHKEFYKAILEDENNSSEQRFMSYLTYKKICTDQERMNRYYGEDQ